MRALAPASELKKVAQKKLEEKIQRDIEELWNRVCNQVELMSTRGWSVTKVDIGDVYNQAVEAIRIRLQELGYKSQQRSEFVCDKYDIRSWYDRFPKVKTVRYYLQIWW